MSAVPRAFGSSPNCFKSKGAEVVCVVVCWKYLLKSSFPSALVDVVGSNPNCFKSIPAAFPVVFVVVVVVVVCLKLFISDEPNVSGRSLAFPTVLVVVVVEVCLKLLISDEP